MSPLSLPSSFSVLLSLSLYPTDSIHANAMNRDTFFSFISFRRPWSFFPFSFFFLSFLSDINRTHTRIRTRRWRDERERERVKKKKKNENAHQTQYGSRELCMCLGRRMNQKLLFLWAKCNYYHHLLARRRVLRRRKKKRKMLERLKVAVFFIHKWGGN